MARRVADRRERRGLSEVEDEQIAHHLQSPLLRKKRHGAHVKLTLV